MIFSVALAMATPINSDWAPIEQFKACFAPIVLAHENRDTGADSHLKNILTTVKRECASQRLAARDALSAIVASRIHDVEGRDVSTGDAWKEELIDEATVRWMNNVVVESAITGKN